MLQNRSRTSRPRTRAVATALALVIPLATPLLAQTGPAWSPSDRGDLEGSTSTSYPLGRHDCRYQHLVADLGAARLLRGMAFRRDALTTRGTIAAFQVDLEVTLSETGVTPGQATSTFAQNAGALPTPSRPRGIVSFPQTDRPTSVPAKSEFRIPYTTPFGWQANGHLCIDISIHGNQTGTTKDRNFSASLDAQELFASGRNLQPGYPFGQGCALPGQPAASCIFELRHLGASLDLGITSRNGVPAAGSLNGQSMLLLSAAATAYPWPHGSQCSVYGMASLTIPLPAPNSATGDWTGTLPVGIPPASAFEMIGQILSADLASGAVVLSDASRLIVPPASPGLVAARIVSASDRTSATGTVAFAVPVLEFY